MPNPIIMDSIAEPPYVIIGSGAPTIGSKPRTIDILPATYAKNAVANPKQNNFPNKILFDHSNTIFKPLWTYFFEWKPHQ